MPAECEIDACGVLAIGRCIDCSNAFCGSHQGIIVASGSPTHGTRMVDLCRNCHARRQEQQFELLRQRAHHTATAPQRIAALAEQLRQAGVPIATRRRFVGMRSRRFGGSEAVYEDVDSAWSVGPHRWYAASKDWSGPADTGVTAGGRLVLMTEDPAAGLWMATEGRPVPSGVTVSQRPSPSFDGSFDAVARALETFAESHGLTVTHEA